MGWKHLTHCALILGFALIQAHATARTSFSFGDLERILVTEEPGSIEELLGHLPDEWLTQYVLMQQSRSAQGASPLHPRVILYGNGGLLLAFNGDPAHRGYHTLEVIQYHPQRGEYEFRAVDFASGKPDVSPPNPTRCTLCHQNPPRPNWEPYPFWPGAVGEADRITEDEVEYLRRFADRGERHPRYRHLKRRENLEQILGQILRFPPAMHLNTHLNRQKTERIAVQSRKTPEYEKFRWALMAGLLDCENLPDFIPGEILSHGKWEWQRLLENTEKRSNALAEPHRRLVDPIENRIVTNLRYLFETRSLKITPWFFSLDGPYLFTTVAAVDARNAVEELVKRDPDLDAVNLDQSAVHRHLSRLGFPTLYRPQHRQAMQNLCTHLKFKSLTAFYE